MVLKVIKWVLIVFVMLITVAFCYYQYLVFSFDTETLPRNYGKFDSQLFLGSGESQPLLVGLGGAEGGNAWAGDYWSEQRNRFLDQGFSFLALGYFGMEGVSRDLDRIPLDGVMGTILAAAQNPNIDESCIILLGGSKGAELSLAMASYYVEIKGVVAIVPGSAIFPAQTIALNTSSFALNDAPLNFVPIPFSATPALIAGDLRAVWEEMLKNDSAMEAAAINVEKINGPIFFLSATQDEMWPSAEMAADMMERLSLKQFPHFSEHVAIAGNHGAPLDHFALIEEFLQAQILNSESSECGRS